MCVRDFLTQVTMSLYFRRLVSAGVGTMDIHACLNKTRLARSHTPPFIRRVLDGREWRAHEQVSVRQPSIVGVRGRISGAEKQAISWTGYVTCTH